MIFHLKKSLGSKNFILASSSPRRKEILQNIGLDIKIIPSTFEENLKPSDFEQPSDYVIATAQGKAKEVSTRLDTGNNFRDVIIGADTCVCHMNEIYGKPKTKDDAFNTLTILSGKEHEVVTGVCVMIKSGEEWKTHCFSQSTSVKFAKMEPQLINAYIDTGEPMDKAGGYGIQGLGGALIEGITGDYYNVMGFPVHMFCKFLQEKISDDIF